MNPGGWLKRILTSGKSSRLDSMRGAAAIEYALIIMTVALVVMIGIGSLGTAVVNLYATIVERIF